MGFATRDPPGNFASGVFVVQDPDLNVGDLDKGGGTPGRVEGIDI